MTGLVLVSAHAGTRFSNVRPGSLTPSGGYLVSHGAPPLRFAEIIVPATPASQLAVNPSTGSASPTAPASSPASSTADHPASADVTVRPPSAGAATVVASSPEKRTPLSILPDEARTQVRPEDFLPYFQIPGTGRNPDVILAVPALPGQPVQPPPQPSSATYIQTDK